ncbi:MAG TPA: hypothetical protein VK698_25765 [Kofleriaceae bacterium]|nr:hypothetical protein [Kofleriaceae bacterium]
MLRLCSAISCLAASAALLAACAPADEVGGELASSSTASPFGDDKSLSPDPAVLTCEESQSAGDDRTHWQLWLDPKPEGGFIFRRAQNIFDPWEGTITLDVQTLREFDDCRAAASEPRLITCFRPGSSFLVTKWVEETSIPIGGADLFTTSHFDMTWQATGPADRESFQFYYFDQECWASADDRLGS